MTPLERAARDKLALLLDPDTARFPTLDFRPGPRNPTCEEVRALIVQHDELVRSMIAPDLRLLLAALDKRENDGEPLSAGEPHQVTMRLASDGFPFPHDTQHPAACDLLRYGQHCQFDQLLDEGHAFPDAPGVFTARIVLAREPEPGDVYTEEPEIHYERTEDA